MVSKKGIGLTAGILAVITIASFLIWTIPQNSDITIFVSDFENHLDGVKGIHEIIVEDIEIEFQKLVDGKITSEEYIQLAEVSSSQINSQIIKLVESKAPEEWHESYLNYIEALKGTNSYIRETIVIANTIDENVVDEDFQNVQNIKSEYETLIVASDNSRP